MRIKATLWVCPLCGSYYGATSTPDLRNLMNTDLKGNPTHNRARCPNSGGVIGRTTPATIHPTTERVPVEVEVEL